MSIEQLVALNNWLKHTWIGEYIASILRYIVYRDFFHSRLKISNKGSVLFTTKEVIGGGNILTVGKHSLLFKVKLKIKGNNNSIRIGEGCKIGYGSSILMYGNNLELYIGDHTSIGHDDELLVQEDGKKLMIGDDCMFSHHINVRTSDAHPIYNLLTAERSNIGKDVYIGNHVWVTAHCIIQKGSHIGSGSIIATHSVVNKDIPENCVAAGMPAKVVKERVRWERK